MEKSLVCIQCPHGCSLIVSLNNDRINEIKGGKCKKGIQYARQEIENPQRVLTSAISTRNLDMRQAPVKTDKPIPKNQIFAAMKEIRKFVLEKPADINEILIKNFLNLDCNLIVTRRVH